MEQKIYMQLACLMFVLVYGDDVSFRCSDIAKQPMTDVSSFFSCTVKRSRLNDGLYCNEIEKIAGHDTRTILKFKVIDRLVDGNHSDVFFQCVGLQFFHFFIHLNSTIIPTQSLLNLEFNVSLPVGVLRTNARSSEITLLKEILNENASTMNPEVASYFAFNFSSPLFGLRHRWFQNVSLAQAPLSTDRFYKLSRTALGRMLEMLANTSTEILHVETEGTHAFPQLRNMPVLKKIEIMESDLTNLSNGNFNGLPEVNHLHIHDCKMRGIPEISEQLPNLKTIEIFYPHGTDSFHIPRNDLSKWSKLGTLNIYGARIISTARKFPLLPQLKEMRLKQCSISEIEDTDFGNFPALETLDLSDNFITFLGQTTFFPLFLKRLDLSQNQLTVFPILRDHSLNLLNLSQNLLNYVQNLGNFRTSVDHLDMSQNEVQEWKDNQMFSLRESPDLWVKRVNFSNNAFNSFSEVMIESLNGLQELDLGGNHLLCSECKFKSFQMWLKTTTVKVVNFGTSNPLLCSFPLEHLGARLVEVQFDDTLCHTNYKTLWISLVTVFSLVIVITFTVCVIVYRYRSRIMYMHNLYKIRRRAKHFCETSYIKYAFDAFICYSGHDRGFVMKHLAPTLEKGPEKYVFCLHERDFPLGSRIVENIVGSIEHSRKTIMVLSEHFIRSKWCNWELEMANHKMFQDDEHFLILIQLGELDRSHLPRHLQFLMDTRTYLEWPKSGDKDEGTLYKRLKGALGPSIFQKTDQGASQLSDLMKDI